MMLDNNDLCLGLAMGLPFTFFLRRSVEKRWLRRLLVIAFALTCVAVVCTLSRGGFLSVCAAEQSWRSRVSATGTSARSSTRASPR
jgi:hypothetical protein